MTEDDFQIIITALRNELYSKGLFRNCVRCEHFSNEICKLANQRPPADIIVNGCKSFLDSEIPY